MDFTRRENKTLRQRPGRASGFSLVELLIAMAVGMIVLGATYSLFLVQQRIFSVQEDYLELQQSLRSAMDLMIREISMAGFNPTGNASAGIVTASASSLNFTLDVTNNAGTGPPDGDTDDANENITYALYTTDGVTRLGRRTSAGAAFQPLAENITALAFTYGTGNRVITLTITGRTARPDPSYPLNNGYRTFTLTGVATPRNVALP